METLRLPHWIGTMVVVFAVFAFSVVPATADWNDGPDVDPDSGGEETAILDTGGTLQGTGSPVTRNDPGSLRGVDRNSYGEWIAEERSGFSFLISFVKAVVRSFWE